MTFTSRVSQNYRARYESEGTRGPLKGQDDNHPAVKVSSWQRMCYANLYHSLFNHRFVEANHVMGKFMFNWYTKTTVSMVLVHWMTQEKENMPS